MKKSVSNALWTARISCSLGAVLFALLQIFGVWNKANFVAIPLLAISLILQTVQEWKDRRGVAIFSLVAVVFVFVCTVAIILL